MKPPHGLRALRHRDFRWFFVGQGVSQMGTWLQMIATSWLVYHLSGSTLLLGVAAFAQQIPFLVLAPVAGVFVDRFDRRRLLMVTNSIAALQASAMFALVALGTVQPWHLIAGNLVLGLVNAWDAPARQSILIQLVGGRADLASAIALNSIMMNLARFLGPMVGGVLIAALGERWGFGANAASYFAMLFALSQIPARPQSSAPADGNMLRQLAAGTRYAYGFLPSRCALLLLTSASVTVGSYVSMMPWFAREAFHGDSGTLGLLISAAGLGALTGMVYLALRPGIRGLFRLIGRTVALAGAALCVFSFSTTLWLALPALYFVGLGLMLTAASSNTVLQSIVPDELRGRVASLYVMSFIGMTPLGALATGWVAEHIGPPHTLLVCGLAGIAATAVYRTQLPAIGRAIRPVYEKLGT
ncbi:MAG TPA: MFS transporter [Burkholderiales bacterium]|nr:MFS transporter [Burkholderiales bacterium]